MTAGILTSIILVVVGALKAPLIKRFKGAKWYKPVLTTITIVLTLGVPVLAQVYILEGALISFDCLTLIAATMAGVFGSYNLVYEGLSVKDGVKRLMLKVKELRAVSPENKFIKKFTKLVDSAQGIDIRTALLAMTSVAQTATPSGQAAPVAPTVSTPTTKPPEAVA